MLDNTIAKRSKRSNEIRGCANRNKDRPFQAGREISAVERVSLLRDRRATGLHSALASRRSARTLLLLGRRLTRRGGAGGRIAIAGIGQRRCRRLILGGLHRVVLRSLLDRTQLGDVLLMRVIGFSERMRAGAVGDEEQVARTRRI